MPTARPDEDDEDTPQPIPGTRQLLQTAPAEDSEQTVVDRLRAVMATTPADRVRVKVYRIDPKTPGRLTWCQDYTPAEFEQGDLAMIRETWGPGAYQIRIIGATGIAARSDVSISAPLIVNPAPAPQAAPDSGVAQALQMLAETQTHILRALQERPDPAAQMMQNLEMLKLMREAMGPTPAQAPSAAPVSSPVTQLTEMLQTMKLLREAAQDIAPSKDDEPSLMTMVPGVLELVKTAMQPGASSAPALPQPIVIPQSIEHPARNPAPLPTPETTEVQPMGILILRGLLQQLIAIADKGESPEVGGEYIADKLPDEIIEYLDLPNWFEILASFAPDVKRHEAWIVAAKNHADVLLTAEDDNQESPPA